ncbi:MAG TPA: NADPH-dependent F420 reductase [Nitrososphaerales archaeon]|nr:NADPH-dependent F420 reductase [Nitrososphaerales archaeon]
MKVAVLGGTGKMGRKLAKQLAKENQVIIGSRDKAKAEAAAREIAGASGDDYTGAARAADVVVVSVPYLAIESLVSLADELAGKLVISMVNPAKMEGGVLSFGKEKGSAAEEIAKMLPKSRVATAFNNVPQSMMGADEVQPMDILVAADSRETFDEAAALVRTIPNLRPLYAGPLSQAEMVERITILLVNLARLNGTKPLWPLFAAKKD